MTLTRAQANTLRGYSWPGNVRELKNVIERAVILSPGNVLRLDLSMPNLNGATMPAPIAEVPVENKVLTEEEMQDLRKKNITAALERSNWRVSGPNGAAELLGVRPTTLADRIRVLGIRKPARR